MVEAPITPPIQVHQWSRGLFGAECSICLGVCFCPCCAMSIVASYVGKNCPLFWGFCGSCFCLWPFLRYSLREKHKIEELHNIGDDFLVCLLLPCMMMQMFGELEYGRYKVAGFKLNQLYGLYNMAHIIWGLKFYSVLCSILIL